MWVLLRDPSENSVLSRPQSARVAGRWAPSEQESEQPHVGAGHSGVGDLPGPRVASGSRSPAGPRPENARFVVTLLLRPAGGDHGAFPPAPHAHLLDNGSGRRGPSETQGRAGRVSPRTPHYTRAPTSVLRSETRAQASECLRLPAGCFPRQWESAPRWPGHLGFSGATWCDAVRAEKLPQTVGSKSLEYLNSGFSQKELC